MQRSNMEGLIIWRKGERVLINGFFAFKFFFFFVCLIFL